MKGPARTWLVLVLTGALAACQRPSPSSDALPPQAPHARILLPPDNEFTAPGWMPDGRFDPPSMLQAWYHAGMKADQAWMLSWQLRDTGPVVQGADDPTWVKCWQHRHELDLTMARQTAPQIAHALQHSSFIDPPTPLPASWNDIQALWTKPSTPPATSQATNPSWRTAQHHLTVAVATARLRALSVPYSDWQSPAALDNVARAIVNADQQLGQWTRWGAGSLGLEGRVWLSLQKPEPADLYGQTKTQICADQSWLFVEGTWPSLGHEWFHAIDMWSATLTLPHPQGQPLSLLSPTTQPSPLGSTMVAVKHDVITVHPAWRARVQAQAKRAHSAYPLVVDEMLAFAFAKEAAQHVSLWNNASLAFINDPLSPTDQEQRQQRLAWSPLFAALAPYRQTAHQAPTPALRLIPISSPSGSKHSSAAP